MSTKPVTTIHAELATIIERMTAKAAEMQLRGIAVAGVWQSDRVLVSRAGYCGKMVEGGWNSLAVAYSKVAEMCDTLKDSGSQARTVPKGEFGFVGGAIIAVGDVHYLASFSGAKGEEDLEISRHGLATVAG